MKIWFRDTQSVADLFQVSKATMAEYLGITWGEIGDDFLKATMPVTDKTAQPYGLLHGGASCVLAETIGSVASAMVIDHSKYYCVGLEINANHIRSARIGETVTATARPLHLGSSTHVWDIRITGVEEKLVCASRLTVAVMTRKEKL